MSTAQETTNKAMFSRFHDAMNTGDAELISKTIDEVFEPDVLIRRHCRFKRPGRKHSNIRHQFRPGPGRGSGRAAAEHGPVPVQFHLRSPGGRHPGG